MSEETNPQNEIEAAWDGSYSFLGETLPEWNHERELAAQDMGMKCPALNEAETECMKAGSPYPGLLKDMAIFFWLLTIKARDEVDKEELKKNPLMWTLERARSAPTLATKEAERYAAEKAYGSLKMTRPAGKNFLEAHNVFMSVMNGVEASKFDLELEKGGEAPSDPHEKKV